MFKTTIIGSNSVQVDGQTPESWSSVLSQFRDANVYQTWAYGAIRWGASNLSHLVIHRDEKVIAAAQLRIVTFPLLPGGLAYLRWGPMCHTKGNALDRSDVSYVLDCLQQEYVGRRRLTLQIIPSAFGANARGTLIQSAMAQVGLKPEPRLAKYQTVLVDLGIPVELIRKRLDQKWRNQLNRSEKNGLTFEVSENSVAYREFQQLYDVMWQRKRFETSVDVGEFGRIQELLSETQKMQTFIARKGKQAVAALVCSLLGDTAIYLLGATNEVGREAKAAYFLHWQAMLWLKEHGACAYDLGGIDQILNPGGYHFKRGFGGEEVSQLPPHVQPSGAFGKILLRGIVSWRRQRADRVVKFR